MNIGVKIDNLDISILLYADDIVLLAENEQNLQQMLTHLYNWCEKWQLEVNQEKTQIVHFRIPSQCKSKYIFKYGNENTIQIVDKYRYLGIVLDEFLNFDATINLLSESGSRALGGLIGKIRNLKYCGYNTFTKLFDSCVSPILDYCSGVWGHKKCDKIESVQNRAMKHFLGINRFAPTYAVRGDMGWFSCHYRRNINTIRLWNRLLSLNDERLPKKLLQ